MHDRVMNSTPLLSVKEAADLAGVNKKTIERAYKKHLDKEEPVYFFYITNATKSSKSTRQVVVDANARCNQENNIAQLKQCALSAHCMT